MHHYRGIPPELAEGEDNREVLPWPCALLMQEQTSGVFIYRLAADGTIAGDTWHSSISDAKEESRYEYGDALGDWEDVPDDVEDPFHYALATCCSSRTPY